MKANASTLALSVIGILFGGIILTSTLGWWQTEANLELLSARYDGIEAQLDPSEIRGSFGFAEISEYFGIPLDTLADAFMLPGTIDPHNFYNRDMEGLYAMVLSGDEEIGNASVQLFVAFYKGLPFNIDEDIYLPQSAVRILEIESNLSEEQLSYLANHTLNINPQQLEAAPSAMIEDGHDEEDAIVKGTTTFYDVLQWGVRESDIIAVLHAEIPPTGMLIRDYCTQQGLEFSVVKTELQSLVDAELP